MKLTLYLPGLLLPQPVLDDTAYDLAAPALSRMLGRSMRRDLPENWLCDAFGVPSPLPVAALRKVGAGGTATGEWICLDPVHWRVSREGITLDDPAHLKLDDKESQALLDAVAPLLADWGVLSASSPGTWELQLSRPAALETPPLPAAIDQNITPRMPAGPDGGEWRRLLAEIQTILHAHPVNRRREEMEKGGQGGRPVVNSLWLWGAGKLPATAATEFTVAWANDPVLAGLALMADIPCIAPPEQYQPASGNILSVVTALEAPARSLNALAWREALLEIERLWIAPAVDAVKRGHCPQFEIVGAASGVPARAISLTATRSGLLRFWRRSQPLTMLQ